jgi:phytanoyl-CoA hydroxylase
MCSILDEKQLGDWCADGFVKIPRFVNERELETIRSRLEALAEEDPPHSGLKIDFDSDLVRDDGGSRSRSARLRAIQHAAHVDDVLWNMYTRRARTLELVNQLLGPDVVFYTDQTFFKPPGGSEIPPHQDNRYWEPYWAGLGKISLWLALDDSTLEKGCTVFRRGSHRNADMSEAHNRVDDGLFAYELDREVLGTGEDVAVELRAGDCCVHHCMTVHSSGRNCSKEFRRGHVAIYFDAHVRTSSSAPSSFPFELIPVTGRTFEGCVGRGVRGR